VHAQSSELWKDLISPDTLTGNATLPVQMGSLPLVESGSSMLPTENSKEEGRRKRRRKRRNRRRRRRRREKEKKEEEKEEEEKAEGEWRRRRRVEEEEDMGSYYTLQGHDLNDMNTSQQAPPPEGSTTSK
jgi:hypothetical protein